MDVETAASEPDAGLVLSKAVVNVAGRLGLSSQALGEIIGLSNATISRMRSGTYALTPSAKSFELAVLLVRLYRSLDGLTGGDDQTARAWLINTNTVLGKKPIDCLKSITGLLDVIRYLDSRRAIL